MTIYAKNINGAQRRALREYEGLCGAEPLFQDELDSGEMTFSEVWRANIRWLEDVLADVVNINLKGTGA